MEQGPAPRMKLGARVAKFRRMASHGLAQMSREDRQAYGAAVEEAVKRAQRAELLGPDRNPEAPVRISLTRIDRLFRYENPIRMAGDATYSERGDVWKNRAEALYTQAMAQKLFKTA